MNSRSLPEFRIEPTPEWIAHFWSQVDRSPGLGPAGACWEWRNATTPAGYGVKGIKLLGTGKPLAYAHRIAYALAHGFIPSGMQVNHDCDNPRCCNPAHLSVGTHLDNMQDANRKGRLLQRKGTLGPSDVAAIRKRYAQGGVTCIALGSAYGVSQSAISAIMRGDIHERTTA